MNHRLLMEVLSYPWALHDSYRPVVAGVLSRLLSGEPLTPSARVAIDAERARWQSLHPALAAWDGDDEEGGDRAPPPPYVRTGGGPGYAGAVAVIGMYGLLSQRGGIDDSSTPISSMARIANSVNAAVADPSVASIVLDVDSPGGTVYGCQELADAIFAARSSKPIAAIANSMMASAAYYTACSAGELYCAPGGEVGSIGVYTEHWDFSARLKELGIAPSLISAGKFKTECNSYGPLTDDARAYLQGTVDSYYDAFVRAVARGRGVALKAVKEGMGQGRMLQGEAAKAEGMIDGVATLSQVISKMQARAKRAGSSARASMRRDLDIAQLG